MPNQYTPPIPIADRFWSKVEKTDGCWLWRGTMISTGYGVFGVVILGKHLNVRAHRLAYELTHGCVLPGFFVCHHCDNRQCVRPDHLFIGAPMDNSRDMVLKRRQARGQKCRHPHKGSMNGRAKLTEDDVRAIRHRYAQGRETMREIARDYSVPTGRVGSVVNRITWRHVE